MSVSLLPIWVLDFVGNTALLLVSVYLVFEAGKIRRLRPHIPLWMYLQWQVVALGVFAVSHSVGHILRRILLMSGHEDLWHVLSPFTGSINTLTFVVVAILTFLYKDIELASESYNLLEAARDAVERSYEKLKETSEEVISKNRELTSLNRIAVDVSTSLEMDKVLAAIVKETRVFLGARFLGVYLIEDNVLALKSSDGMPDGLLKKVGFIKAEEPWFKRVVLVGKPFLVKERADEKAGRIDPEIKKEGILSWAAVPIVSRGNTLGALMAGSTNHDGIDERNMETLATIGRYAGVIIENAKLYEELKLKVEDLERFRRFSVGREMRIIELKEKLDVAGEGRGGKG